MRKSCESGGPFRVWIWVAARRRERVVRCTIVCARSSNTVLLTSRYIRDRSQMHFRSVGYHPI